MNGTLGRLALVAALMMVGCVRIDSGHAGVLWTMLGGTQVDEIYGEGLQIVAPWNRMYVYSVRRQDVKERLHILASNGLSVDLETSVRFRPDPASLPKLHTEVGPRYYEVILGPILRSEAREVGGRYLPEEIYASKREEVAGAIFDAVKQALDDKDIILEAVLIRDVGLPANIQKAIADKLEEEQKALKMQYVLAREEREAERKKIEARGIAEFQKVVSEGISPALLKWKGIEATHLLATSANTKIIVIGSGEKGLPVILGGAN